MPEPPIKKEDGKYYGKFNILDTPCGRIVYTLAKAGFRLGVSSRGNGDYDEYTGEVDPDSYDFTCFDVVVLPAVKDARMSLVTEGLGEKTKMQKFKSLLTEQLKHETNKNKELIKETVTHLFKTKKEWEDIMNKKEEPKMTEDFQYIGNAKVISTLPKVGEPYGNQNDYIIRIDKKGSKDGYTIYDIVAQDKESRDRKLGDNVDVSHWEVALKEQLNEEKEIPDVKVEDDTLTVDIDEPKVDETGVKEEPCEECKEFDEKLKSFLDTFLSRILVFMSLTSSKTAAIPSAVLRSSSIALINCSLRLFIKSISSLSSSIPTAFLIAKSRLSRHV